MRVYLSTPQTTVRIDDEGVSHALESWEQALLHTHREQLFASQEERDSHEYDIYLDENNGFCEVFVRPIGERYSIKQFKLNLTIPS